MWLQILILVAGFIVLVKGADLFVDAASSLAENFKLSKMFIALTIVAFGTSAPELAVSIKSMINGSGDIVLGNVVGSNILNILLILGVAGTIHALRVKNSTVKKELPIVMLLSVLLSVIMCDKLISGAKVNTITRSDGVIIVLFFLVFIYYLISTMRNKTEEEEETKPKFNILLSIIFTLVGIACLVFGSHFVVDSASKIAKMLHVSERMISLTVVALGTSLPELVTSVVATRKGEYDIAIGNVVGSNIFNIGVVIGLPVALIGGINHFTISYVDLIAMIASCLLLFICSFKDYRINRKEGILFLLLFVGYYSYVILG